jgi:hypothetical protein
MYTKFSSGNKEERQTGGTRRRWDDTSKMDFNRIRIEFVDWIELGQNRVQWRAFVKTVTKLGAP